MSKKPNKPAAQTPPATGEQAPARQRQALSMEKRLGIALAAVLAIIDRLIENKDAKAHFLAGDAEPISKAKALADEINEKTIGPIKRRIDELSKEIAAAGTLEKLTAPGGAQALKDLVNELSQKQKRLASLNEQATGA